MNLLFRYRNSHQGLAGGNERGFTLLEFLIATTLFLVVSGATFAMFATHAPYFSRQQNTAALNIAMQNVVSQMQLDLVNAGTGYYAGSNIPSWPIGVSIRNQTSGTACNNASTFTYGATCFDTLNVLTMNPNVPPAHPTDASGNPAACSSMTSGTFYIQPSGLQTPTQTAANFSSGDQVLVVKGGNGALMNSFILSAAPVVGTNNVALPHDAVTDTTNFTNTSADDPLDISTHTPPSATPPIPSKLGNTFCGTDWVMKLAPVVYKIDVTTASNPKLIRKVGAQQDTLAEQIIGFKVGAAVWNNPQDAASQTAYEAYHFDPADYNYDYSLIRSVRVALVGRTNPNPDPTYTFRNTFDGGPYQVGGATVVISPRNMSMNGY